MRGNALLEMIATGVTACALAGCATGDRFADRATTYNLEVEQVQDKAILLNILRASEHRPLTFTQLSLSASGTASGSIGVNLPIAENGERLASSAAPLLSLSGGPTLSVTPLDTQEFYQGLLKPVPLSTIDLFVQRGVPEELIFDLLFSRIIVRTRLGPAEKVPIETFVADNSAETAQQTYAYQALVEALLNRGLTTTSERPASTPVGPILTTSDLTKSDLMAQTTAAGLELKRLEWCDLDPSERLDIAARKRFSATAVEDDIRLAPQALHLISSSIDALDRRKHRRPVSPVDLCDIINNADLYDEIDRAEVDSYRNKIIAALTKHSSPTIFYQFFKIDPTPRFSICFADGDGGGVFSSRNLGGASGCSAAGVNPPLRRSNEHEPLVAVIQSNRNLKKSAAANPASQQSDNQVAAPDPLCVALNALEHDGDPLRCVERPLDWDGEGFTIDLVPRSTFDVIDYLGEIVRRENDPAANARGPVRIKVGPRHEAIPSGDCDEIAPHATFRDHSDFACEALFSLLRTKRIQSGLLSVRYDDITYEVPAADNAGASNDALDIVNELLAINKSAKDLPTSNTVTVLGVP